MASAVYKFPSSLESGMFCSEIFQGNHRIRSGPWEKFASDPLYFPYNESAPFQAIHLAEKNGRNRIYFALNWVALQPEPQRWNEDLIALIRKNLTISIDHRQRPTLILQMYQTPDWFQKAGGWQKKQAGEFFGTYAAKMAKEFGGLVKEWIPIGAPQKLIEKGWLRGTLPPFKKWDRSGAVAAAAGLASAHVAAVCAIRRLVDSPSVGVYFNADVYSEWDDGFLKGLLDGTFRGAFFRKKIETIEKPFDFIGVDLEDHGEPENDLGKISKALCRNFVDLSEKYPFPIKICGDRIFTKTERRGVSLRACHLFGIWQAIQMGVPIECLSFPLPDGKFPKEEILCSEIVQKKMLDTEVLKAFSPDFWKVLFH